MKPEEHLRAMEAMGRATQIRMAGERIPRQLSDERWAKLAEQKRPIVIDRRPTEPQGIAVSRGIALGAFGSLFLVSLTVGALCWYSTVGVIAMASALGCIVALATIGSACVHPSYDDEDDIAEGAM